MCAKSTLLFFGVLVLDVLNKIDAENVFYKGMFTNSLTEAEITHPKRVNEFGQHISHLATHYHQGNNVHYNITLGNTTRFLILTPISDFIAPHLIVERRKRDIHTRKRLREELLNCHYVGKIHGEDNSNVIMSSCNGLAGLIKTNGEEYWIEPEHHEVKRVKSGHRHLIFRRSAIDSRTQSQMHGQRKKRKKKKHHVKNCGTKEPRRFTELELEWQKRRGRFKVQGKRKHKIKSNAMSHKKYRQRNWKKHLRKPRSVSRPRYVETLLVADNSMTEFHEDGDVEMYLLTIMNMVSSLYRDPTIGNLVNVVVVKIILLEDTDPEFNVTVNADQTLKSFCRWQETFNPSNDTHPHHHDVAILVTREDICARKNTPCNTLGVAHVAGMCHRSKSCSVNEDNGITLAHTITHEMGHNFGMYHDTEKTGCHRKEGHKMHVMTPSFEADAIGVSWSRCSRRDITNFFDQGLGGCLDDKPLTRNYTYPALPAGAMYNANHQCRLQFGAEAEVCTPLEEICSRLWCEVDGVCTSLLKPAAPGTNCGKHMWCQNQECVPIVDPPPVIDGGWGAWSEWSECSRSCGAGVSIRTRECDHPKPAAGGKFCVGERKRYRICNSDPCPPEEKSFRALQCSKHDQETYNGQLYKWTPYFEASEPCELYCQDANETVIVPWGEHAEDGTPCKVGARDLCISGICRKVGCDWVVDSDAREDDCGVCQGDGSTCDIVHGIFEEENLAAGYKEIVIIPKDSRNIKIEEMDNSDNYLCIGSANDSNKFYLNGNRQITISGEYQVAETSALYQRDNNELEKIFIPGPIKEDIMIYVIFAANSPNAGITYQYTVNKRPIPPNRTYNWSLSEWSACSTTCGGGLQQRRPICLASDGTSVETTFCPPDGQPESRIRKCHFDPCPTHWWVGPWQSCPVTCHTKGVKPMRRRSVMCVDDREIAIFDHFCDKSTRPVEHEPCSSLPKCSEAR